MEVLRSGRRSPAGRISPGRGTALTLAAAAVWWALPPRPARADVSIPDTTPCRVVSLQTGQEVPLNAIPLLSDSLPAIGVPQMLGKYPFITGGAVTYGGQTFAAQTIAIIDTGIDYTHPALAGRYVGGYDFADNDDDPMDTFGHGTHVAGIAVSTDSVYRGVAPGANVAALKVFQDGSGTATDSDIVSALFWVLNNAETYNITAVNISLGGDEAWRHSDVNPLYLSEWVLGELKQKGIFVACASGNEGYLHGISYPAASPYTVSVGATWANNDYSNYIVYWDDTQQWNPGGGFVPSRMADNGPEKDNILVLTNRYTSENDGRLDLLAPGALVTSTVPLSLDTDDGNQDGFTALLGTSMATPHAAAASVLVRQALELAGLLDPDPARQVDQILGILRNTGNPLNDWYVLLMQQAGPGDHVNLVQSPKDDDDFYSHWWIRAGSNGAYPLIDLYAAISSIDPVPEPACLAFLGAGAALLVLRRKRRGPIGGQDLRSP